MRVLAFCCFPSRPFLLSGPESLCAFNDNHISGCFTRGQTGWTFQQLERFPEDLCLHRPPAKDGKDQAVTVVVSSAWNLLSLNRRRRSLSSSWVAFCPRRVM